MDEQPWWHAEYSDQTTLHPLGLAMVFACGLAMLVLPRRYALWPMLVMACFVAPAQRLVVFGLDFNLLRVMVLFGWLRVLTRAEATGFVWKPLDTLLIVWAVVQTITYTALMGTSAAFVNRLGMSFDAVGMYFVFRCLIRNWCDVQNLVLGFVVLSIPVALAFVIENQTGRNAFAVFGGVPHVTAIREGRLRCQGAFSHPILAGCFWAAVMPLIAARWWTDPQHRWLAATGLLMCGIIVVCCASSTPVMAVLAGLVGAAAFCLRRRMRLVRWCIVLGLLALHLVMKAPVWHLVSRVGPVGGSTAWHRYNVINQAIERFGEWWLLGTRSVAHWGVWAGDITNQYVVEGISGGVWKLGLFVAIIAVSFRAVGRLCQACDADPPRLITAWALGVSLFVHCTAFIGVTYFGQIIMVWYLTLAIIGSLVGERSRVRRGKNRRLIIQRGPLAGHHLLRRHARKPSPAH